MLFRSPERLDRGDLQFEQRILIWIDIDAMNAIRIVDQIIQRIAAGTRNHHNAIARTNAQHCVIDGWIFPTLVINKISRVDRMEKPG